VTPQHPHSEPSISRQPFDAVLPHEADATDPQDRAAPVKRNVQVDAGTRLYAERNPGTGEASDVARLRYSRFRTGTGASRLEIHVPIRRSRFSPRTRHRKTADG
jgi:hypothetical protein